VHALFITKIEYVCSIFHKRMHMFCDVKFRVKWDLRTCGKFEFQKNMLVDVQIGQNFNNDLTRIESACIFKEALLLCYCLKQVMKIWFKIDKKYIHKERLMRERPRTYLKLKHDIFTIIYKSKGNIRYNSYIPHIHHNIIKIWSNSEDRKIWGYNEDNFKWG